MNLTLISYAAPRVFVPVVRVRAPRVGATTPTPTSPVVASTVGAPEDQGTVLAGRYEALSVRTKVAIGAAYLASTAVGAVWAASAAYAAWGWLAAIPCFFLGGALGGTVAVLATAFLLG